MEIKNLFGKRIKELRKESQLTLEYVAKKLNISIAALSRYEKGSFEPKSLALIIQFADLYKVSTDYLLGITELKNPEINFDKLDIGLTNQLYESLTEKEKIKLKKFITLLFDDK